MNLTRRGLLAAGAAALGGLAPARLRAEPNAGSAFTLDDASRLNATPIFRDVTAGASNEARTLGVLRAVLKEAASGRRPVAVYGARHSMGGQCLPRNGDAITLAAPPVVPNLEARTYRVGAGARWRDVIEALDPLG